MLVEDLYYIIFSFLPWNECYDTCVIFGLKPCLNRICLPTIQQICDMTTEYVHVLIYIHQHGQSADESALTSACRHGHYNIVLYIIQSCGVSLDYSHLNYIAQSGNLALMEYVLSVIDLDRLSFYRRWMTESPLDVAIEYGHKKLAEELFLHGFTVGMHGSGYLVSQGWTDFMYLDSIHFNKDDIIIAYVNAQWDMMDYLLYKLLTKLNSNLINTLIQQTHPGRSKVDITSQHQCYGVEQVLSFGIRGGPEAYDYAIKCNNLDLIRLLYKYNVKMHPRTLEVAVINKRVDIIRFLLEMRAPSNNKFINTVYNSGDLCLVKMLVEYGIGFTPTAVTNAARKGYSHILEYVFGLGGVGNADALNQACRYGHYDVVVLLLRHKIRPTKAGRYYAKRRTLINLEVRDYTNT